ncbi:MAG TPA: hypothetical protein VE641_03310, partial [Chthoniobacterales bacterium]|nr:hypothetical protein [Chthoniobacterales bacterium]
YAGGAHHTVYSYTVKTEYLENFAEITGVELAIIDRQTNLREFKEQLRFGELYYQLACGRNVF